MNAITSYGMDGGVLATCMAVNGGHTAALQVLLDGRADVDRAPRPICSPLFLAIHKDCAPALEMLLLAKANPNQRATGRDGFEQAPLSVAADMDRGEAVRLLALHKADVGASMKPDGCTAAHVAAAKAHVSALRQLLLAKADTMTQRTTLGTIWHTFTLPAGATVRDFVRAGKRRDVGDVLKQHHDHDYDVAVVAAKAHER